MLSPIESARLLEIKARRIKLCIQPYVGIVDLPIPDLRNSFRMVVAHEKEYGPIYIPWEQMKSVGYCLPGCLTKEESLIDRDNLGPHYQLCINSVALSKALELNVTRKNGVLVPA